jgi:hypothetical protein
MNRLDFEGLNEFVLDLRRMPAELHDEAERLVEDATETGATALRQAYPRREGGLRRGVKTSIKRTQYEVVGTLSSSAPHANLYEFGTGVLRLGGAKPIRRYTGPWKHGKSTGSSPPHATLVPIAVRLRRILTVKLAALITRHGFRVTDAA